LLILGILTKSPGFFINYHSKLVFLQKLELSSAVVSGPSGRIKDNIYRYVDHGPLLPSAWAGWGGFDIEVELEAAI
jgi:hypothetical protein